MQEPAVTYVRYFAGRNYRLTICTFDEPAFKAVECQYQAFAREKAAARAVPFAADVESAVGGTFKMIGAFSKQC
jgi:hypothetical protein